MKVVVVTQMPYPSVLENSRQQLADRRCQCYSTKVPWADGSSLAELFGISLITAALQLEGTLPSMMTLLKKSIRVRQRAGHYFKIVKDIC